MNGFEVAGTRGFYHPISRVSFDQGVELVAQALLRARELGLEDIVVNTTGFSGFEVPGVFERYALATRWVQCARGYLRLAIVALPELIDSQKIAMLIAQNRGVSAEIFASETEALAWLDRRLTGRDVRPMSVRGAHPGN